MTRDPTVDLVAESARAEVFKQQEAVMNVGSLPANRAVALTSLVVSIGSVIAAFAGVFPTGTQNTALAIAGLLLHAPTAVTFLLGAQKSEALQASARAFESAKRPPPVSPTSAPTPGLSTPTAAIPIRPATNPPPPPPPQTG